jgi:hypothetical protein
MAQLGQTFDANSVAPATPFETIPAGKYLAQIVNSEMKSTSTGGEMLVLEIEIVDGEYSKRRLWDRLNLVNSNATAVEIAQRALSSICHAVGQMTVQDSEQLHFKPMAVTVKVRPAGPDKNGIHRDAQNEIKGYEAANGQRSVSAAPASRPNATSATKPAGQMPWQKHKAA